jgi:hypothetical protein
MEQALRAQQTRVAAVVVQAVRVVALHPSLAVQAAVVL